MVTVGACVYPYPAFVICKSVTWPFVSIAFAVAVFPTEGPDIVTSGSDP